MKIHPQTLFDYSAGCYCGVLVTERIMKKLAKLQHEHSEAVKRLFMDNRDDVFPSMWTLSKASGTQETVRYIDTTATLEQRIASATRCDSPRACYPVFIAGSMQEAEAMGDEYYTSKAEAI